MRRLALLLLLALVLPACQGQRMKAKCSACRAVATELVERLDKEKPRNHLDMRHRLDKHGNRYGKVIDYKMSELRVIELLEDLCDGLNEYEFVAEDKNKSTPARWAKSSELGANRDFNRVLMQEQQKLLSSYCADLIERHEDEVTHAIRNREHDANDISDYLCFELSKHCPTQEQQPPTAEGGEGATTQGEQQGAGKEEGEAAAVEEADAAAKEEL